MPVTDCKTCVASLNTKRCAASKRLHYGGRALRDKSRRRQCAGRPGEKAGRHVGGALTNVFGQPGRIRPRCSSRADRSALLEPTCKSPTPPGQCAPFCLYSSRDRYMCRARALGCAGVCGFRHGPHRIDKEFRGGRGPVQGYPICTTLAARAGDAAERGDRLLATCKVSRAWEESRLIRCRGVLTGPEKTPY